LALIVASLVPGKAVPIDIAPTTDTSIGNATAAGFFGQIYNFNAIAGTYSVPNLLNPALGFGTTQVGTYEASTAHGIAYGVPDSADSQSLATWMGSDGSTIVYTAPHITQVFNSGTNQGTLLELNGYILVTPSMLNVPLTYSLGLDDGGYLVINGTVVINNGGIHGATTVTQQVVFTKAGLYPISIGYYDGHATQAVLIASFAGATILATPNGVALTSIQLSEPAQTIQNYLTLVAGTSPTDPTFIRAETALLNLSLGGAPISVYEAALKELSPLKYAELDEEAGGNVDFITSDLDDYLSHRRDDAGTFRSGNDLDLSGLSVLGGNIDPSLQDVAQHLLAFNGSNLAPGLLSDSPIGGIETREPSKPVQPWNVFSRGTVVLSQNFSAGGLQHTEATAGTIQVGADYQVSPNMLMGAFFGYSRGSSSLDEEGSTATANSYIPGVYASYTQGGWYGNALAAGGVNEFDVSRNIQFPGFSANAQSKPNGEEEFAYLSGGRDYHSGNWTFGPTAGLQYLHMSTDSFTEQGAGLLDLDVNAYDNDSLKSRLGGRIYYAASDGNQIWRPFLDASWQHEFMGNTSSLTSQFSGAGVGTFSVATPGNSRESALISVGTDIDINQTSTVFTAYRVEAGSENFFAQSVEAGFKLTF
jgi:uncharacterized protein YhjY with autotransporter beta-barrel domain